MRKQFFGTTQVVVNSEVGLTLVTPAKGRQFEVPLGICALAAGKDAWMKNILFQCKQCHTDVAASLMCGDICEDCATMECGE